MAVCPKETRLMYGHYHRLMRELRMEDTSSFCNFMRMEPQMFDELVDRLSPRITLQDTNWRKALEPGLKVAVTLRYLASGDRYPSLSYIQLQSFTSHHCQVHPTGLPGYCEWIQEWSCSMSHHSWGMENCYWCVWKNMEHPSCCRCIGWEARRPSIIILALVDTVYNFTWVDVGSMGHMSDAQIFNGSELKECFEDGTINLPPPEPMTNDDRPTPYFMLADDAFALRTYLMKPHSRRGMTDASN